MVHNNDKSICFLVGYHYSIVVYAFYLLLQHVKGMQENPPYKVVGEISSGSVNRR
jgi:hypothetical protein